MTFSISEYIEELREMVNIDTGTLTVEGNARLIEIIEKKYAAIGGWNVKRINCDKAGFGLEVRNKPEAEKIDVLIIGHIDTVFPAGTVAERPMTHDDEKIYGPGAADMKCGILSIVCAMRTLEKAISDKLSICICMNPDEEIGSIYSGDWLTSVALKSKKVIVAEPGKPNGALVYARKGAATYRINFTGKASHAGNAPLLGRSAITEMADWILALNALNNYEAGLTLNVGVIKGGTATNIVAEFAEAGLDMRFWKIEDYEKAMLTINAMAAKPFLDGVTVTLTKKFEKPPMTQNKEGEAFMALVEECGKEVGIPIIWVAAGGVSDANLTSSLGIPSLDSFGPNGANAHAIDEYLIIDSVEPRIKLMQKILEKVAEQTA